MTPTTRQRLTGPFPNLSGLTADLKNAVRGEVRFDELTRTLYATDASLYEITPAGVVIPRDREDIIMTVKSCAGYGIPITARGGGTGLTGGAVGGGVCLDCSKYLNRIGPIDVERRTVRVQAGVVLDELNAVLAPHGLHFAPDVATGSRATIGGMIANNSCGAHSVIYGRTVDYVRQLTAVLSDGSVANWGKGLGNSLAGSGFRVQGSEKKAQGTPARRDLVAGNREQGTSNPLAARIEAELVRIIADYQDDIICRYPKVLRKNGGYGLDRLLEPRPGLDPCRIICGSEGTLCVVTEAVLNLIPLPKHRGLLVVHFDDLLDSLSATPLILNHRPAAVELIDRMIFDAAARNPNMAKRRHFLQGDPAAILVVEMFGEKANDVADRLNDLGRELSQQRVGYARVLITDPDAQSDVWEIRKSGLGLLMSRPGEHKAYEFIEDAAVDPSCLRAYIERLSAVLAEENVHEIAYYAHASVGCLHVRPVLNLRRSEDVARLYRIGEKVSGLVLEFGGSMTGEHGDGLVRSCWLEKMYGPRLVKAFEEVKAAFDPHNLFNPGKIVDPPPMNENLRIHPGLHVVEVKTQLDFSEHGGMAGMATMCNGVGQCRQRLVGTMCPSYMATGDEMHTTRARANALRAALTHPHLLHGLDDPRLDEVMDLCLSCKACKTECPTGVDMARLKAEWQAHKNLRQGVSRQARIIAATPRLAAWGSRFAPVSNWVLQSKPVRRLMERRYGLAANIPPPRFARNTFRHWWRRHVRMRNKDRGIGKRGPVVYFVDTWTNYYTPQVGVATVRLLEAVGYQVLVPSVYCCGRPMISKGMLTEAAYLAEMNVRILSSFLDDDTPIVGSEPSCILTLVDELPQLVRSAEAKAIAERTWTAESFLSRIVRSEPNAFPFRDLSRRIIYHGHCHQKALIGTEDAMSILNAPPGYRATEINSGCCGMAGSFGHEAEHYEVARLIGEQRLFPAVRGCADAEVAVSGFSCRHQIAHHTGVHPHHVLEYLAEAL